ncbi:hypothetical protein AC578_995 [Pseudocercospora eumusae]|uniref:Uncharacterized protein n=1 Tax=Pseudocercospora eumusae TaxID=321146 RepID=A0A139GU88_9PEZI|nr:hypothetical protein AC578_995 [Pseudocercospora eumusae]
MSVVLCCALSSDCLISEGVALTANSFKRIQIAQAMRVHSDRRPRSMHDPRRMKTDRRPLHHHCHICPANHYCMAATANRRLRPPHFSQSDEPQLSFSHVASGDKVD